MMAHPTTQVGGEPLNAPLAVGVPVFSRTEALRIFLESVPDYVATVYIADNGHYDERRDLYSQPWPFDLEVLELEYDVGIGACRRAIVDAIKEPYLWMGDCDMEFLRDSDLRDLGRILNARPNLGGVSAWLLEGDTVRSGARHIVEDGRRLYKTVDKSPTVECEPLPHGEADMIPQSGLFRHEVYETYSYDAEMMNTEHLDFFIGQQRAGEWAFASSPAAVVAHHRNIDEEYRESRGQDHTDLDLLKDKWGITQVHNGRRADWVATKEQPLHEDCFDVFRRVAPRRVWTPVYRGVKSLL